MSQVASKGGGHTRPPPLQVTARARGARVVEGFGGGQNETQGATSHTMREPSAFRAIHENFEKL